MHHRFLISVAAAALIAGTGFVQAQDSGGSPKGGGASSPSVAPPSPRGGSSAVPMNRDEPGARGTDSGRGSDSGSQSSQSEPKGGERSKAAQDQGPGQKSNMSQDRGDNSRGDNSKNGKDMKAEDRNNSRDNNRNADQGRDRDRSSTTTGQAGAGAKLSGEQRTKITTVIKQQRVEPATNVNFSISVGTRVPREVRFHPLPAEILTVYPDWRGYQFFLVRDEIIVVDPRTMEIVAVLDA
jgi:hypothetical protein